MLMFWALIVCNIKYKIPELRSFVAVYATNNVILKNVELGIVSYTVFSQWRNQLFFLGGAKKIQNAKN